MRRVLSSVALFFVFGALLAPASAGCFGKECDGDFQFWGGGSLIDPDTFQTTPLNGKWIKHSHRRTWLIDSSLLGDRTIDWVIAYISPAEEPNKVPPPGVDPDNFIVGSGNAAEVKLMRSDGCRVPPNWVVDPNLQSCFYVVNDTCADYYLRVVAHAAPRPPAVDAGADAGDAGPRPDGGAADAAADAPADALTE